MGDCRTRPEAKTSRISGEGGFAADVYTLDRGISAIPVCSSENNKDRPTLGSVTQFPPEARCKSAETDLTTGPSKCGATARSSLFSWLI